MQTTHGLITMTDYPDPDVIRVEDTYYMVSTTMHFMPGAVILRSYNLRDWEIASYVFDSFKESDEAKLTGTQNSYGCGMWAASLRYHRGRFYVCFGARKTGKTYIFSAGDIEGPWECICLDHYYHDASLFFDDDGRAYLIYGNTDIRILELNRDLTGAMPGGLKRLLVTDTDQVILGYEGSHFYKINGAYYLFMIHWPATGTKRRTQVCFRSGSLTGEFTGRTVLDDDMGYHNCGVAQGGIVETGDGQWFGILFQDHGAVGRVPVLVPVHWKDGMPVFGDDGRIPAKVCAPDNRPGYRYEPLYTSDDFVYGKNAAGGYDLKKQWQWNHEPLPGLWTVREGGGLQITTDRICVNVTEAVNSLTQRLMLPRSAVEVTVDASGLKDGDLAGLCALQGCYAYLALTRDAGRYYLVLVRRDKTDRERQQGRSDHESGTVAERIAWEGPVASLGMEADFEDGRDCVQFRYRKPEEKEWNRIGEPHRLFFGLDHFTGCRCALSVYSTVRAGGYAVFRRFVYECGKRI